MSIQYLTDHAANSANDLLKFITCGSVDDGKSTLIGHLLYDTKQVYTDQEKALELDSRIGSRAGKIDYSLLLDGLMAEREQGITIDVAYRYFTTDRRSFIVADTPGHEEYTRNMAVGASFAELAVILVDARAGVLVQTRRHARICAMMGIRKFCFAVNKMDLANYDEERFLELTAQIHGLQEEVGLEEVAVIPVSATEGDNVTRHSGNMCWYHGPTLLEYLETVRTAEIPGGGEALPDGDPDDRPAGSPPAGFGGFYLPVQRVCRPDHRFRGFQGMIEEGEIAVGDAVTILPGEETAHICSILKGFEERQHAFAGEAVTVSLDREVDVSRGSVLVRDGEIPVSGTFEAQILWMDDVPLIPGKQILVKIGTRKVPGIVTKLQYQIDVNTGRQKPSNALEKNEIGVCGISLTDAVVVDTFARHRTLGELILIDRVTNMTSACGVVTQVQTQGTFRQDRPVTQTERSALLGQSPAAAVFRMGENGITERFVEQVETQLAAAGRHTYLYRPERGERIEPVLQHLTRAGLVTLLLLEEELSEAVPERAAAHCMTGWKNESPEDLRETVQRILKETAPAEYAGADGWII